jgi:hypothetical protein
MDTAAALEFLRQRLSSKTYRTATILGILSFLEIHFEIISPFIPEQYRPLMVLVWPVAMMTLREYTSTALKDK